MDEWLALFFSGFDQGALDMLCLSARHNVHFAKRNRYIQHFLQTQRFLSLGV